MLVQLADLMPNYMFNAYGAATDWIARDRALMGDAVAAMIEANRAIYRDKAKVVPDHHGGDARSRRRPSSSPARSLTKNCVWSVNEGFNPERTQWTIDNDVANGYIEAEKKPTVDQVINLKLASDAVEAAGGRVKIGNCTE